MYAQIIRYAFAIRFRARKRKKTKNRYGVESVVRFQTVFCFSSCLCFWKFRKLPILTIIRKMCHLFIFFSQFFLLCVSRKRTKFAHAQNKNRRYGSAEPYGESVSYRLRIHSSQTFYLGLKGFVVAAVCLDPSKLQTLTTVLARFCTTVSLQQEVVSLQRR